MLRKRILINALVCSASLTFAVSATSARAIVAPQLFSIPAGTLKSALDSYVRQSGVQLLYRSDEAESVRSSGVRGAMQPAAALNALLAGSGYVAKGDGTDAIVIVRNSAGIRKIRADLPTTGMAAAPAAAPEAEAADTIQEIVVTAQRRSEKLQDVPIAISVLSANAVDKAGVSGTESLGAAVPSLQFSRQTANGGTPFLRGVGSAQAVQGFEAPVAVYVDDVYIGSPSATIMSFNNIAQIEVLKGPQGTLFGRNATGGVVHIRTKRPSHDASLDASVSYGNYGTYEGNLYATGGVTDTLAVNFAASGRNQTDGYGIDVNTGDEVFKSKNFGLRGEALWEPTDATTVLLSSDYSRGRSDEGLNGTVLPGAVTLGGGTYPGRYRTTAVPADTYRTTQYGGSARIDQDLGGLKLASITAYRRSIIDDELLDGDSSAANIISTTLKATNRTFSQELQLLSPSDQSLKWILGAFYYWTSAGYDPLTLTGSTQAGAGGRLDLVDIQKLNSYSAFGELNYEILPDTKVTAGVRYTSDKFHNRALRTNAAGVALAPTPFEQSSTFSKVTYRFVLDHHFTDDIMGYASYSRGFKSGGYNVSAPTITVAGATVPGPPVAPEILDAFEVGAKTEWFDRKLQINVAAFQYKYKDLQVSVIGTGTSSTINAAAAKIKGVDLDFQATPARGLTLSGGVAYLHSKFSSFPNGPLLVPNPAVCTPVPMTTGPRTGGNRTCAADLSGNRTPRAPKFSASTTLSYTFETSIGQIGMSGAIYHNSGYFWEADNRLRQPGYTTLAASTSWTSLDGKYDVKLWGKNLTKAYYSTFSSGTGLRDYSTPAPPRTYGVTLGVHY